MARTTLVLNGGGMRSLVATAITMQEAQRDRHASAPTLLFIDDGRPFAAVFRTFSLRQARHFDVAAHHELAIPHLSGRIGHAEGRDDARLPLRRAQLLLAASGQALQMQADRVIWPIQVGSGFDDIAGVTESVVLMRHLIETEHGRDMPIETPLLEMTDAQLVEVGQQMDVPWMLARSCMVKPDDPCMRCAACTRRASAFGGAQIDDPLLFAVAEASSASP